jgi:hypothetical protein
VTTASCTMLAVIPTWESHDDGTCYEESGKSKLRNSDNGGKLVLRKYEDLRRR